ncbi:class I SAM-dependent methyltransferase, partial [Streptomyces kunmingensis]
AAVRSGELPEDRLADAAGVELPAAHYDVITCLASLHHMPFATLTRFRDALAPGGRLLVLGCYAGHTYRDLAAVPVNAVARVAVYGTERARGIRTPPRKAPVRQPEMTLPRLRAESARLLPGSELRQLLFWRYLLTYTK